MLESGEWEKQVEGLELLNSLAKQDPKVTWPDSGVLVDQDQKFSISSDLHPVFLKGRIRIRSEHTGTINYPTTIRYSLAKLNYK